VYFNYLVNKFINVADGDFEEALQRISNEYAESSLKNYNNDEKNKI
jgi:hypothetical protein